MIFAFMITKTSRTFKILSTQWANVTSLYITMTVVYMSFQTGFVLENFVTILALESCSSYWSNNVDFDFL